MTNRRKMRNGFHGLSLGFSAIVCALAASSGDLHSGSAPAARGGGPALDAARPVASVPPPGDQLSPACDDTPLSTACAPDPDGTPAIGSSPRAVRDG